MLEKVVRRNTVSLVSVVISLSMNWLWREESEEEGKKRGRRGEEEGKKRGRRGEEVTGYECCCPRLIMVAMATDVDT